MVLEIPSQYRELLAQFGSLAEIDNRLRYRYDAQSWTALERIAQVADVLHASAQCEVAILDGDRDRFVPVHVDAAESGDKRGIVTCCARVRSLLRRAILAVR